MSDTAQSENTEQPVKTGKRGRPRGSLNKKTAPTANGHVETNHNETQRQPNVAKSPLSDDQEHQLTAHHAKAYERALAAKKKAAADFLNVTKLAKAEGVPVKQIKEYIEYQTEEGQEALREDLKRKQKVAIWAGLPAGTQLNFLDEVDRVPLEDRAYQDGKRSGLKGEPLDPPRHYPGDIMIRYGDGWRAGQEILGSRMKQHHAEQREEDGKTFDDPKPEEKDANDEVEE